MRFSDIIQELFCQLLTDFSGHVNGESLAIRPSKIVAGHEPEKTNGMLQMIGKFCLDKVRNFLLGFGSRFFIKYYFQPASTKY